MYAVNKKKKTILPLVIRCVVLIIFCHLFYRLPLMSANFVSIPSTALKKTKTFKFLALFVKFFGKDLGMYEECLKNLGVGGNSLEFLIQENF